MNSTARGSYAAIVDCEAVITTPAIIGGAAIACRCGHGEWFPTREAADAALAAHVVKRMPYVNQKRCIDCFEPIMPSRVRCVDCASLKIQITKQARGTRGYTNNYVAFTSERARQAERRTRNGAA